MLAGHGDDQRDGHDDGQDDHHPDRHDDGEWVMIGEAARRLGVSRSAIYGRIGRRTLETRPKGNRGVEVRLPAGHRHPPHRCDIAHDGKGQEQGGVHGDGRVPSRVEELIERAVRAESRLEAAVALAKNEVEAARRVAAAEVEAVKRQLATVGEVLAKAEARADRLEAALAEARRPWLARLLDSVRRRH